jgi:hypothetical protein
MCTVSLVPATLAQRDRDGRDWVQLGCRDVSFRGTDRDTISVGRREGRFRAIRLSARGSDIELVRVEVIYRNGDPDRLDVQRVVRSGDRTEALDLRGRERSIDRIDLVYRQRDRDRDRDRATVCAEGLVS